MRDVSSNTPVVSIVNDDESVREALKGFIQSIGFRAEIFPSAEDFLASNNLDKTSCIIVDVHMPVMTGLELQCRLDSSRCRIPGACLFFPGPSKEQNLKLKTSLQRQ
jgi:FixJ family two-component response regulator